MTTSFTYQSTTTRLATAADPDGSVVTFAYNGANLLNLVQEPGSRSVTVSHSGSDLTGVVNPRQGVADAGLRHEPPADRGPVGADAGDLHLRHH